MLNIVKNEGMLDRVLRGFAAEVLVLAGLFWLQGAFVFVAYAAAVVLACTAITGFCALYKPLKWNTTRFGVKGGRWSLVAIAIIAVALAAVGSYYSIFFTKKFFVEDFNRMNQPYKQALLETGQGKREEAVADFKKFQTAHAAFRAKYESNRPFTLRDDELLASDMAKVTGIIAEVDGTIHTGDLPAVHLQMEAIRPIYQDMLKRNGFSMLSVTLVDFHDAMEAVLASATSKNADLVIKTYAGADEKLKEVETIANDEEIQGIRASLEAMKAAAESGKADELPDLGAKLKSSFIKVYLKRG